jgi:hypothetical protein
VIISEIMYHPKPPTPDDLAIDPSLTDDDLEYIEIYNPTGDIVLLTDWRIRGGIDFDFVPGTVLADDGNLVVVSFDPGDTLRANAFRNHYGIDASVTLVGGYSGRLDNGGERVQLQRPDEPPPEEPDFIPRLLEDEALYDDADPWPVEPDGSGQSLTRYPSDTWGRAATSWEAAAPTPGDTSLHTLVVTALRTTPRGFVAEFDRPLDARHLSLYDDESGTLGPADVTLVGDSVGAVSGSLVFGPQSVTFVASGGRLPADTYTVTLRSGHDGFQGMTVGELLDGNGDGTGGDDYVNTFTTAPVEPVVVSLADFMRGPGQSVDVPAAPQSGLPFHVSQADGIRTIDVVLEYDPNLLTITDVDVGPDMPADATAQINWFRDRGALRWVSMTFRTSAAAVPPPLPPGPADVMTVVANVPPSAPYGRTQVLQFLVASINQPPLDDPITATMQESVQVVGFLGDTTGNQTYSGLDAQRAARVAVRLDRGFVAYPNIDPAIVADVTGNGGISGLDAQRIAVEAVGLDADEIPPLPQALRLAAPVIQASHTSGNQESRVRSAHQIAGRNTEAPTGARSAPYVLTGARSAPYVLTGARSAPYVLTGARSAPYMLTDAQLAPVVEAAKANIGAVDPGVAARLENVMFEIVDLPGNLLGLTAGSTIWIDVNAAGYGWIVEKDEGQRTKDEVSSGTDETLLAMRPSSFLLHPSVDLLTAVTHELGHVLGYEHSDAGLMGELLPLSTRLVWDKAWFLDEAVDCS